MATNFQAIMVHLREDTGSGGLVELLPGASADQIKPKGLIVPTTTFPAVAVDMSHRSGPTRELPNQEQVFDVYAYTHTEGRNTKDYVTLDRILDRVLKRLHGVIVSDFSTSIDEDFKPFEIKYDGFTSRYLWDSTLRADYRWRRFRMYGIQSTDPRN